MNVIPFIPKDDAALPDHYSMTVHFHNGQKEEFEVAQHKNLDIVQVGVSSFQASAAPMLEYVTKDDIWGLIPISAIKRIEFDKRFSKIMERKQADAAKAAQERNDPPSQ